jgi:hypothetical protein
MKPPCDSEDEDFAKKRQEEENEKLQKKIATFDVDTRPER